MINLKPITEEIIKPFCRITIKAVKEDMPLYQLNSSDGVARFLRDYFKEHDREELVVLCLDAQNQINAFNVATIGSLSQAIIHPREIFKSAILSNSASIIIAHNHPSGTCRPSPDDDAITLKLKRAGEILGIPLLDHLIIGDSKHFSYSDSRSILNFNRRKESDSGK